MTDNAPSSVADASPQNWVDTRAPAFARPYLRLARADRPIGTWLLLLPCWWSVALATDDWRHAWLLALFALGAVVMRGAGCTYNDIVDRDIDAAVARTRSRPLPSGAVSLRAAWAFLAVQCLIGLAVLLALNAYAIWLGFASLALVAIYPFMKRIADWPQIVLGLAFNWGALMGWAAVHGALSAAPLALYAGAVFWTIGYDTIYAHQDRADDAIVGVRSSALRLGPATYKWMWVFYGAALAGFAAAGALAGLGFLFWIGLGVGAAHLVRQIRRLDIDDPSLCLQLFRGNRDFGLILFAAILAGQFL